MFSLVSQSFKTKNRLRMQHPVPPASLLFLLAVFLCAFGVFQDHPVHAEESYRVDWNEPLPADFVEKVAQSEKRFQAKWRKFDRKNLDKILYYGLFRGQAMGEFKLAFDERENLKDSIFLLLLGKDQSTVRYPRVENFATHHGKMVFTLQDKGIGYYGRYGSLVKLRGPGKEGLYLAGTFRFSSGRNGLLSGKAFGIRVGRPASLKGPLGIRNAKLLERILRVGE